jgi:hypothetical protein
MRAASARAALLIIRAASAPAAPAAAAAAHSAAHLLWPRGLSAAARPEPRRAAPHRTRVSFTLLSLRNGHKLGCHNNQYRNKELNGDLEALAVWAFYWDSMGLHILGSWEVHMGLQL